MENLSTSLSEEIGKPVEDIQSTYIKRKINNLENQELEDLIEIKRLVNVERAILDETDESLHQIIGDEKERRRLKFLVGKEISGYPHISKKYKKSLKNINSRNLPKRPDEIQSDIVAKGVIENRFGSSKSRALVQIEQQVLGEKNYRINSFAEPEYEWSNDIDRRYYYRIYRELKPEEFKEGNYSGRYQGFF